MKIKVIHLLRRLERIERDLEELEQLDKSLQDGREYTSRLRDSLVEESLRLKQLKQRILSQVIKNPPDVANTVVSTTLPETEKKQTKPGTVEIILPGKKASRESAKNTELTETSIPNLTEEKKEQAPVKSVERKADKEPFKFVFNDKR